MHTPTISTLRNRLPLLPWCLTLTLVACGGSEAAPEPIANTQASTGNEVIEDEEPIEEEPEAEVEPANGPAQLTVVTKVGNDVVRARVKLLGEDGGVAAEGEAGSPMTVQSGSVTIIASIDDATVMFDKPTVRQRVSVSAGATATENVTFPRAWVRFTVSINGRPDPKATVTLKRNGAALGTITAGGEFTAITPGRYEAVVKSKNTEITVPEIVIPEDARRDIPLNLTL